MEIKIKPPARIGDYDRGVAAERERIIKILRSMELRAFSRTEYMENLELILFLINDRNVL